MCGLAPLGPLVPRPGSARRRSVRQCADLTRLLLSQRDQNVARVGPAVPVYRRRGRAVGPRHQQDAVWADPAATTSAVEPESPPRTAMYGFGKSKGLHVLPPVADTDTGDAMAPSVAPVDNSPMEQSRSSARRLFPPWTFASIENGRLVPKPDTALRLDEVLGANGEVVDAANKAREDAAAPWLRPWADHETEATLIRTFHPNLVPGLLQTEAYARAILAVGPHTLKQVEEMTATRLARQAATLDRATPVTISAVVGEPALRCGDPVILAGQIRHLDQAGRAARCHHPGHPHGRRLPPGSDGSLRPGFTRGAPYGRLRGRPATRPSRRGRRRCVRSKLDVGSDILACAATGIDAGTDNEGGR